MFWERNHVFVSSFLGLNSDEIEMCLQYFMASLGMDFLTRLFNNNNNKFLFSCNSTKFSEWEQKLV